MLIQLRTWTFGRLPAAPLVAITMVLSLAASGDVSGQSAGFDFRISPSEMVLAAPDPYDAELQHYEMWDSPIGRIIKNSRPFLEIRNTSTAGSGIQLNEFRITIGDEDFNFSDDIFGAFTQVGTTTPLVSFTSATEDDDNELVITFGDGGLAPNEVVRFQIDLDSDDPLATKNPDYRMVFFDLFENDNSDNSRLTANFTDSNDDPVTLTGFLRDGDPDSLTNYVNGAVRPYSDMERVQVTGFELIPEPSSVLLGLIAMAGGAAAMMRRRLG